MELRQSKLQLGVIAGLICLLYVFTGSTNEVSRRGYSAT